MTLEPEPVTSVFVYGTLKRGQCREHLWPHRPTRIVVARLQAELWGRHDYPALSPGDHLVTGELWQFQPEQVPMTVQVLDQIEGTNGNSPTDLYHRHVVQVRTDVNEQISAYTYYYARDPSEDGFQPVPVQNGYQSWP
ncbi:MAG: gamma-glutamylcyclotransferase family protein [Planctomycetota bacterium]